MMQSLLSSHIIYWLILSLFLLGMYGMLEKKNLMKKLIGMNIMQVSVIGFFLTLGQKSGATLPILLPGVVEAQNYVNPLPHALMLTAIVVSLSVTGVALALLMMIQRNFGELEEDELLRRMNK